MEHTNKKWKVVKCESNLPNCWCRVIQTIDDEVVMPPGVISTEFAEYVVKLHNDSLDPDKVLCGLCGRSKSECCCIVYS